jgi:tetraacyldisaccharide 4'-kinase
MLKRLRYLLFPFSILYGVVISIRNRLFDKNILRSASFDLPLICVGNLSVGGTGKTPMVEYLIKLLYERFKVSTLSRGYKRKSKGFKIAGKNSTAVDIGDEPMQIHTKFPEITVAVANERVTAIPQLIFENPEIELIILDDAFQHREVKAGLNILLTAYNHLYPGDILLPAGNLRDEKRSSHRADIIVVTKSKSTLNEEEKNQIVQQINPLSHQKIYFSKIIYGDVYELFNGKKAFLHADQSILLICGIADPQPVLEELNHKIKSLQLMKFPDHHSYNEEDIQKIKKQFLQISGNNKLILTTEKDAVRLKKFESMFDKIPVAVLPMSHEFLFGQGPEFEIDVLQFINSFSEENRSK